MSSGFSENKGLWGCSVLQAHKTSLRSILFCIYPICWDIIILVKEISIFLV